MKTTLLNSAILTITLGVMAWVGHKAAENAEQLASTRARVDAMKEANAKAEASHRETLLRLETRLEEMVPRREFEAKLLLEETKLREHEIEILKLKKR